MNRTFVILGAFIFSAAAAAGAAQAPLERSPFAAAANYDSVYKAEAQRRQDLLGKLTPLDDAARETSSPRHRGA